MDVFSLLEWRLIPWSNKGFDFTKEPTEGNPSGTRTWIRVGPKLTEVLVEGINTKNSMKKFRYVFTVNREFEDVSIESAKKGFEGIAEEAGEHLYGGQGIPEQIRVVLQVYDEETKTWKNIPEMP